MILAIDPGTTESAWIIWDGKEIIAKGFDANKIVLRSVVEFYRRGPKDESLPPIQKLIIEQIASYGMPVGEETFTTVFWYGRFAECWESGGGEFHLMPRNDVKMNLCGTKKAKDGNIRQALIDRFGLPGVKKSPGMLYGVSKHDWAALALAVTWWDLNAQ